jgi:thiol-disulfide isomerase/thioredoxin
LDDDAETGANEVRVKRSATVIAAMVVLITLLIWAGVHNRRERMLAVQNHATLAPTSQTGAAAGDEEEVNLRGKAAPAFTLVDLEGKKVSLAELKGHPVLVNFWATWCAPCKLEMPWFEEFHTKYAPQGLQILGISMDDVGKDEIAKTAKKTGATYPILLKDDKIDTAYGGVNLLPESFYIDKNGVITEQTAGVGSKDQIEANIRKLLAASGQ